MTTRDKFIEKFGETLAEKLELACKYHEHDTMDKNHGDDEFKFVLSQCIGFQCFELDSYREYHKIHEASFEDIKEWIRDNNILDEYNGEPDYISLFAGAYEPFIKKFDKS